jgi:hypothetical protein
MSTIKDDAVITVEVPGRVGSFSAPAIVVDMMIARHLPSSAEALRAICEERAGHPMPYVTNVATALVILADWEHATIVDSLR